MGFVGWMATPLGRGLRVAVGALLIYVGLSMVQGVAGSILTAIGVLPIATGLLNVCPIAPLFGGPFKGSPRTLSKT
jgi:membrane-associated protease RseP (regulator of RpoE activity)